MISLEDVPLFDVDTPPVRTPRRQSAGAGKPKWSKYQTVRGAKCDDCLLVLAEAAGEGPATRPARWRRIQDGTDLLLCYGHAEIRRTEDELRAAADREG